MPRTSVSLCPEEFPASLRPYLGEKAFDTSSSPEARVWFLPAHGLYLKRAPLGTLEREASMTSYFYNLGLSVEVADYLSDGCDYLLTVAGKGLPATDAHYLKDGHRLATLMGEGLRALHETAADGCPVPDRTSDYLKTVTERYRAGVFDPTFLPEGMSLTRDEAYGLVLDASPALRRDSLLHGDFCLPNILLCQDRITHYIDLGGGGVGDRHIHLFWGAWTLRFNLGTDAFRDTFFSAYGRELVDGEMLCAIAAADCFG